MTLCSVSLVLFWFSCEMHVITFFGLIKNPIVSNHWFRPINQSMRWGFVQCFIVSFHLLHPCSIFLFIIYYLFYLFYTLFLVFTLIENVRLLPVLSSSKPITMCHTHQPHPSQPVTIWAACTVTRHTLPVSPWLRFLSNSSISSSSKLDGQWHCSKWPAHHHLRHWELPRFPDGINDNKIMNRCRAQSLRFDTEIFIETVTRVIFFPHLNFFPLSLIHMQPSYLIFSLFPPLKHLPILSHAYAAIIPIFFTISTTQTSSHSLSCVCNHQTHFYHYFFHLKFFQFFLMHIQSTCRLVPNLGVFNTWWSPHIMMRVDVIPK